MNNYYGNDSIVEQVGTRVQTYMSHVYGWMTVGLVLSGLVAWYASSSQQMFFLLFNLDSGGISLSGFSWFLLIAEFGLVFALSGMINRLSGSMATGLFCLFSVLNGLSLMPIFITYTSSSIASVFFITAGMFGALSFYGYSTKRDLSAIGRFLFMGLVGIVIASIANIFMKSAPMMWAITYISVFIFAGLTAYDTQKLKEFGMNVSSEDGNVFRRFVILGSLTLYLDFINLFIMLLRILGDRR